VLVPEPQVPVQARAAPSCGGSPSAGTDFRKARFPTGSSSGKAGGLANQLDSLPTLYFGAPEARRHDVLLEQLGGLHLLAQAYRRQTELDAALVGDVRARVGWTLTRDELTSSSDALRRRARWTVLATRRESQPDSLVRHETFLAASEAGQLHFDSRQRRT
jgi:hypothetical protein